MSDLATRYGIAPEQVRRGRRLKAAAWAAPPVMAVLPAIVFILLSLLTAGTNLLPLTVFAGIVLTLIGLAAGIVLSGMFIYRRSRWTREMRELIAARGIKAEELDWFRGEIKPGEKRALKAVGRADALLADAYRETLASRITATRIIQSSKRELNASKRRHQKLKSLTSENSRAFRKQIESDIANTERINAEAKEMLVEAESRLHMIEAAAARGSSTEGNRIALKKLEMSNNALPQALREAMETEELRNDAERELLEQDRLADDEDRSGHNRSAKGNRESRSDA